MINLEDMTLTELKTLAKVHNIKNISKLKKDELIIVLKQLVSEENKVDNGTQLSTNEEDENKKEIIERQYDENGDPIIDYKLTNEGDAIVEGILDILPDGYGFLRGDNYLSSDKDVYISMVQI